MKVGNDNEFTLETVENPVADEKDEPHKKETAPYEGNGVLGNVNVGDEITYEITYRNYKTEAATVIIKDKLDKNVEFVSASDGGTLHIFKQNLPNGEKLTILVKIIGKIRFSAIHHFVIV